MSIVVKAGAGLVAGMVAGALGLAFLPQVESNALKPRQAVGAPEFVDAGGKAEPTPTVATAAKPAEPTPPVVSAPPVVAAPPVVVAKAAEPEPQSPKPKLVAVKAESPPPQVAAIAPAAAPVVGETRSIRLPDAPKPIPTPVATETSAAPASPPPPASAASASWSVQGLVALAKGDLSSARLYLARAAEAGDPRAFVALADTYDPAVLAKLGVVVAPGDVQRAKDYLVKAAAAGIVVPKDRLAALDQDAASVH